MAKPKKRKRKRPVRPGSTPNPDPIDFAVNPAPKTPQSICYNCQTRLSETDQFCGNCGQKRTRLEISLWSLVSDFLAQQFSLEGKLFRTLKALLVSPGKLTNDFCEGRRARYFTPIQIYLITGVVFFLVLDIFSGFDRLSPIQVGSSDIEKAMVYEGVRDVKFGTESVEMTSAQFNEFVKTPPDELNSFLEKYDFKLGVTARFFAQGTHQLFQPGGLKSFVTTYFNIISQSVLVMMPVFGFFIYGLYRRSAAGLVQAVVFSAHVHAFNYLMMVAFSFVAVIWSSDLLFSLLSLINFAYLVVASRCVFGASYIAAILKSVIAISVYMFAILIFVVLLVPFVFLAM